MVPTAGEGGTSTDAEDGIGYRVEDAGGNIGNAEQEDLETAENSVRR